VIAHTKRFIKLVSEHRYGITLAAFISVAIITGLS